MQKLHLVGFTTDHRAVILSARRGARSGGFVFEVDDAVLAAIEEARRHAPEDDTAAADAEADQEAAESRPQSALSVRELQARLRSGRTIESVAQEAGVDVEWVARFGGPILAEQARTIDRTRSATFGRSRLGPSALPLAASVYRNLVDRGITTPADELDRDWTARQVADGGWLVTFSYTSRGRAQHAIWELDPRTGTVQAHNKLAGDLAFVPGADRPASSTSKPAKPSLVPAAEPSATDHAVAKRVAAARKVNEAQLADAARKASKRNAAAQRRVGTTSRRAAADEADVADAAPAASQAVDVDAAPAKAAVTKTKPMVKAKVRAKAAATATAAAPARVPATAARVDAPVGDGETAAELAAALAAVRRQAEAEISRFASSRSTSPRPAVARAADTRPARAPDKAPSRVAATAPEPPPLPAPAAEPRRRRAATPAAPPAPEPGRGARQQARAKAEEADRAERAGRGLRRRRNAPAQRATTQPTPAAPAAPAVPAVPAVPVQRRAPASPPAAAASAAPAPVARPSRQRLAARPTPSAAPRPAVAQRAAAGPAPGSRALGRANTTDLPAAARQDRVRVRAVSPEPSKGRTPVPAPTFRPDLAAPAARNGAKPAAPTGSTPASRQRRREPLRAR